MNSRSTRMESLEFDDISLANQLFGPHNIHLDLLSEISGADISSRGASVVVRHGDKAVRESLCSFFLQLYGLLRSGTELDAKDIPKAYSSFLSNPGLQLSNIYGKASSIRLPHKTVSAKNVTQKSYVEILRTSEMTFAVGPAGTGKTYLAVAMALSMLAQNKVKRIVLTRPAVEAGERLGFLPGDLTEKVNPYLRPLYDALNDMLPQAKVAAMLETGIIEVAPLAFMRGRTINDAYIILDEAQNTTREQMKMFLTRMGYGSRIVVTGDVSQIDLPLQNGEEPRFRSGLVHALHILKSVQGISFILFNKEDVVRHPLVGAIVSAYDKNTK